MKKKFEVNCLGWCNKKFMSIDPKTNRLCNKCSEKLKNMTNDLGKYGTKSTRRIMGD
jgi:hypothetical protein